MTYFLLLRNGAKFDDEQGNFDLGKCNFEDVRSFNMKQLHRHLAEIYGEQEISNLDEI